MQFKKYPDSFWRGISNNVLLLHFTANWRFLPSDFSFWVAANMPLDDNLRLQILSINCPTQRLRRELEIVRKVSEGYDWFAHWKFSGSSQSYRFFGGGRGRTFGGRGGWDDRNCPCDWGAREHDGRACPSRFLVPKFYRPLSFQSPATQAGSIWTIVITQNPHCVRMIATITLHKHSCENAFFFARREHFFCLHMITRGIEHFVEYIQGLLFEFSVHSLLVICKIVAWSAFFFSVLSSPAMNPNVRPFGTFETKMADLRNGERSTSTILLKNRELWAVCFWRWTLQRKRREICSSSTVWCKLSPIGGLKMWHNELLENLPGVAEPLLSNSYVLFNSAVSCVAVNVRLR